MKIENPTVWSGFSLSEGIPVWQEILFFVCIAVAVVSSCHEKILSMPTSKLITLEKHAVFKESLQDNTPPPPVHCICDMHYYHPPYKFCILYIYYYFYEQPNVTYVMGGLDLEH